MPEQLGKVAGTEHRAPAPAAPHVRRLAREVGVDIYEVKGSGPANLLASAQLWKGEPFGRAAASFVVSMAISNPEMMEIISKIPFCFFSRMSVVVYL